MNPIVENGTIEKTEEKVSDLRSIGRIDRSVFEKEFGDLQTDEVVLTDEREMHIKGRHPQDYVFFEKYGIEAIQNPDIVMVDEKHEATTFLIKKLPETNLNVVLRLVLDLDAKGENSILTFFRLRDSNLKKMLKKNRVLYNRK